MSSQAAELAQHLARHAEAVCRHYLPNGRRKGATGSSAMSTTRPAAASMSG